MTPLRFAISNSEQNKQILTNFFFFRTIRLVLKMEVLKQVRNVLKEFFCRLITHFGIVFLNNQQQKKDFISRHCLGFILVYIVIVFAN